MKIVRFRGRFVAAAVISLLCAVAVLRSLLLHDDNTQGDFVADSHVDGSALDNSNKGGGGGRRHMKGEKEKMRKAEEFAQQRKLPFDDEKKDRKSFYFKKKNKDSENNADDIQQDQQRQHNSVDGITSDIKDVNRNDNNIRNSNNDIDVKNSNDNNKKDNNVNSVDVNSQLVDVNSNKAVAPAVGNDQQQQPAVDRSQNKIDSSNVNNNDLTNLQHDKLTNDVNQFNNNNNNNLNVNNQQQQQQVQQNQQIQQQAGQNQLPQLTTENELALPAHLQQAKYPVLYNGKFVPTRRIVHLDLKGAHPKLTYFEKFFELISRMGATGILIEYEDTFPFTGPLAFARSGRAYSEKSIKTILSWAKKYNLEVIPLVQTFGHLEWMLKHDKFKQYREVDRYAQVICLSNFDAVQLVKTAIDQVMAFHKNTGEFFHMGADEAFQIGMCDRCQKTIRTQLNNNRDRLMLRHIANISSYVREKYGKRVLMWHDMLNNVDSQTIKEYYVDKLVEPVVWAYAENLNDYLMPDMWMRFANTFKYIWGSSAYKGADGPSRYHSNVPHYLQNHMSWTGQMTREYKNFKEFRGIIMTGWQRFDHFAVLCELLPVGVPSLAVNLLTIQFGNYDRSILKRASRFLECSGTLEIESQGIGAYCQFPGAKIYQFIQQFHSAQLNMKSTLLDDYQLRGWLSNFNIRHNYSSAFYLDQVADKVNMYRNELSSISRQLRTEMLKIFFSDTVDEFFYTYVTPDVEKLNDLYKSAQSIAKIPTFPGRPFPIAGAETPKPGEPTTTESP